MKAAPSILCSDEKERIKYARCCFHCEELGAKCESSSCRFGYNKKGYFVKDKRGVPKSKTCVSCLKTYCEPFKPDSQTC